MKLPATSLLPLLAVAALEAVSVAAETPEQGSKPLRRRSDPKCQCCTALARVPSLNGKVFTSNDVRYTARLAEYYSANAAQAPWCMVFPEKTEDVADLMRVLTQKQCPFGMRSGGHAAWTGSNGIKDGVTVDFGYMNTTTYNEATKVASIQPGSDWGKSYATLNSFNVVPVGGRADVVGVGGFTTGGGYSFHSNLRGFACDNVVNFEVVIADGSIVNANAAEHTDLYRALKGGSGNFGFVTRIDTEVFPSSQIYAALHILPVATKPLINQMYIDFVNNEETIGSESQIIVAQNWQGGSFGVGAILSNVNGIKLPLFDTFSTGAIQTLEQAGPAAEVVEIFTGSTPLGLFATWQTGMVAHDINMMAAMDEIMLDTINQMRVAAPNASFDMIFQLQPVTKSIVDKSAARGGNVMGLEAVVAQGPAIMYNVPFTVDTAANQALLLPLFFEMNRRILARADELGMNRHWTYLNYAEGSQDPFSGYGAENIAFMKSVSQSYDPNGVFQNLRKTGFHLPK